MSWHKITKSFKGGHDEYQIRIPDGVRLTKGEWETVLEWLGEHTSGGHAYGYSINTTRLRRRSDKLRVCSYPAGLCASLVGKGDKVTTVTEMIK